MTDFSTRAVHGPESADPGRAFPHASPIHQTTSFTFPSVRDGIAAFQGSGDYLYTRKANPTIRELERHVAALEAVPVSTPTGERGPGVEVDSLFFTTGMAAIAAAALGVAAGGRVVCQGGIYGNTESLMTRLEAYGIRVDFARAGDLEELGAAVAGESPRSEPPKLVWVECPANPLLQVTDLEAAARIAHDAGALLGVDATFASPALQRPLAWGADLSVHSTTKYIAGHGVVLGGVVSGDPALLSEKIEPFRATFGGSADPFAAWLTSLGLRTLPLRMERSSATADALAEFLSGQAAVREVFRARIADAPPGQLASAGPMLSFEVDGGEEAALDTVDRLRLITLAPTLGNLDTLVQHPWSMSHAVVPEERKLEMGIRPGILRLSVGLEAAGDLIEDLEGALRN